ncbi:MAG: phenylacetate--CoA ligase family protein [Syntrophaceae bacterium]|nr:phenylacetate--CoA ligase family protein [Syntrophaceae bacterium]
MNRIIFKLGYLLKRPMILKYYNEFMQNKFKSVAELEIQQNNALKQMIEFCFDYVPYYQRLFKSIGLDKQAFRSINDLEKIPVLTKAQIKSEPESFYPTNIKISYINRSTGGSTGVPLKYRMAAQCYERGVAILLKGWSVAGYRLGDKMAIIAGASLVSNQQSLKANIQDYALNVRHYSSYGMNHDLIHKYALHMNQWKPLYLRGYASSLYLLAKYIDENSVRLNFKLKGIFSTAEVLSINQRSLIERVFNVRVFDNYGLNDGGISAFECHLHKGMHIDFERSILQTVNDSGKVVTGEIGRIIATSLYNYAMPFVRYDTGDLGFIDDVDICKCGNPRPLLKSVYGRTTDYLKLNNNVIGSPVLTVLMGKINVEHYQIVQINADEIDIKYVNKTLLDAKDRNFIEKSFFEHVGSIKINFKKVTSEELLAKNKHKFIMNEVCI